MLRWDDNVKRVMAIVSYLQKRPRKSIHVLDDFGQCGGSSGVVASAEGKVDSAGVQVIGMEREGSKWLFTYGAGVSHALWPAPSTSRSTSQPGRPTLRPTGTSAAPDIPGDNTWRDNTWSNAFTVVGPDSGSLPGALPCFYDLMSHVSYAILKVYSPTSRNRTSLAKTYSGSQTDYIRNPFITLTNRMGIIFSLVQKSY